MVVTRPGQGPWHMRYKVVPQFRLAKLVNIFFPWQIVRLPEGMEDFKDQKLDFQCSKSMFLTYKK